MPNQEARLDRLFKALADPTRRAVVARLCRGPAAVAELARHFDMALPSFLQHLSVLKACELIESQKSGRVRMVRLRPKALRQAESWIAQQRDQWERRRDQFDDYVKSLKPKDAES
ncbi:MAG: metalloregulator ArsR/SmtB family transcription factor [Phycisphaerae bacterium]|nr:metalloregulator ArsR/SmtB family transcription factor [Phycisphaerae bacterium]